MLLDLFIAILFLRLYWWWQTRLDRKSMSQHLLNRPLWGGRHDAGPNAAKR